jgi:hypothetical protein
VLRALMATECSFAESDGPHRGYPVIGKAHGYERTVQNTGTDGMLS